MSVSDNPSLSHVDTSGNVRMVDVSDKGVTQRTAVASAIVTMRLDVLEQLLAGRLKKGEALTTAKIAGINAAKWTAHLIPLCHPLPLQWIDVTFSRCGTGLQPVNPPAPGSLKITATARTSARTGVEMEALMAASVAALAVYDMAKAADKSIVIGPVQLDHKAGGRSGDYRREGAD